MPEVITKYPVVLIKELQDAGIKCGAGIKQQILTACPKDKFCRAPTGEICVYTLDEIPTMTQINLSDISEVVNGVPTMWSSTNLMLLILFFGIGMVLGMIINQSKN